MLASILSNPALMSRNSVETLSLGLCRVLTSGVRDRQGSKARRQGREPYWLGLSMPLKWTRLESLTVMTRSRIFKMVFRRTMIRKVERQLEEGFPGLSKSMPFAFLREGGW